MDLTELYRSGHSRVSERVAALTPTELGASVPGTPLWTVAQVTAHLVGVASAVVNDRLGQGVGTPQWTGDHVAQRAGQSIPEILAEWRECVAKLDPVPEAGVVRDLLIHEADLSGALGTADAPPADAVDWVLEFALEDLGRRINDAGLGGLTVSSGSRDQLVGPAPGDGTVSTTPWELFRSLAGRRSAAQVRRYRWDGDPEPYLLVWNRYGPLPVDDVAERPG
jgi:uncharacterized protein (TIGR03083 family)